MDEDVHPARFFRREILANIKIRTSPAMCTGKLVTSKRVTRPMPERPGKNVLPGFFDGITNRRNDA
jgi:hypothetical protein